MALVAEISTKEKQGFKLIGTSFKNIEWLVGINLI